MFKVFWIAFFLQLFFLSQSWRWSRRRRRRRAPRPCSWQTCSYKWNDNFSPSVVRQGICAGQIRFAEHVYSTHYSTAPCPGSSSCSRISDSRTRCKYAVFSIQRPYMIHNNSNVYLELQRAQSTLAQRTRLIGTVILCP